MDTDEIKLQLICLVYIFMGAVVLYVFIQKSSLKLKSWRFQFKQKNSKAPFQKDLCCITEASRTMASLDVMLWLRLSVSTAFHVLVMWMSIMFGPNWWADRLTKAPLVVWLKLKIIPILYHIYTKGSHTMYLPLLTSQKNIYTLINWLNFAEIIITNKNEQRPSGKGTEKTGE